MLHIYLLQHWLLLFDPGAEDSLHHIPTLPQFMQLSALHDIFDETTILTFCRLLERHGLDGQPLDSASSVLA